MSVTLVVDKIDGAYHWQVEVCDFVFKRHQIKGIENTPLKACRAAERVGERELEKLLPAWVRTALLHKWRPPAT